MSIASAQMKARNIRRRVRKTSQKQLTFLDKLVDTAAYDPASDDSIDTVPYKVIGAAKIWDYEQLTRGQRGEQRYRFWIQQDAVATPDVLNRCTLCFGTQVMEVITRTPPDGEKESVAWLFTATPSGDTCNGA